MKPSPAAIVRPAASLAELAAWIGAEHQAGEVSAAKGVGHFRRAGEALLKAKALVGHGKWLKWLKANVSFSQQTANCYMRLAAAKLPAAGNLREALRYLSAEEGDEDEEEDVPYSAAALAALEGLPADVQAKVMQQWEDQVKGEGDGDKGEDNEEKATRAQNSRPEARQTTPDDLRCPRCGETVLCGRCGEWAPA